MSAAVQGVFRKALRHSNWDALLIALSLVHGGVLLAIPSASIIAIGLWWNANTISHNFVHLPFFRSAFSNRCYSFYLSLVLGFPQSLWRDLHLAHHAGKPYRTRITSAVLLDAAVVFALAGKAVQVAAPGVAGIARLGARKLLAGETTAAAMLDADYIRRSDAELFARP